MNSLNDIMDFQATLVGSIAVGATAVGAPTNTKGFAQVMAVITAGAAFGTGGNAAALNVKIQESDTATAIGSDWSDIENCTVNGTMAFAELAWADVTDPNPLQGKIYEQFGDGKRKQFIRAHATLSGTAGSSPKYAVGFLLENPVDTVAYITNATSVSTGNAEYTVGA